MENSEELQTTIVAGGRRGKKKKRSDRDPRISRDLCAPVTPRRRTKSRCHRNSTVCIQMYAWDPWTRLNGPELVSKRLGCFQSRRSSYMQAAHLSDGAQLQTSYVCQVTSPILSPPRPSPSAKAQKTPRETGTPPSIVSSPVVFSSRDTPSTFPKSLSGLKRKAVSMAEKESPSGMRMEKDSGKDTSPSSTPDLWMLKWLQIHRRSLLRDMQNVVPKILDYLVEKGKIDPLESDVYQEIMLDTTAPLQKARKLLDWLATQPPDVFWSFQHAIRQDCLQTEAVHRLAVSDKEMRDLMELVKNMSLPERLDLMSCRGVLKAREELRKTYRSRDELLMSAGLAKGKTMTMDKILVNVCLLSSEEAKKAFEEPSFSSQKDRERCEYLFSKVLQGQPSLLDLKEVFRAKREGEKDPYKVVASGGAGCGKSVCFTRKAPYDWAVGDLWEEFALLFCLELRDKSVWQAETLQELLKLAQLGLSPEEQEEVRQFITNHPDKVVIVCDGLDEASVDEFKGGMMWSLLQGKCVGIPSSLRLVVTTRPCSTARELLQSTSYRGVEVVGFTNEDVSLFARKYLGEETSRKLRSILDKQPSIASMMHAPLFCLLICDLFQEQQELPSRRTEIFQKIVVALLHRYAQTRQLQISIPGLDRRSCQLERAGDWIGKSRVPRSSEEAALLHRCGTGQSRHAAGSSGAWSSCEIGKHQLLEARRVHLLPPDSSGVSRRPVRVQPTSEDRRRRGQATGECSFLRWPSDDVLDFSSRFAGRQFGGSTPCQGSHRHFWTVSG